MKTKEFTQLVKQAVQSKKYDPELVRLLRATSILANHLANEIEKLKEGK